MEYSLTLDQLIAYLNTIRKVVDGKARVFGGLSHINGSCEPLNTVNAYSSDGDVWITLKRPGLQEDIEEGESSPLTGTRKNQRH